MLLLRDACDAAWRVVLVLAEALVPWGAPVEAVPSASNAASLARLGAALVVYGVALAGVRRMARAYPGAAALSLATLAAAPVVSVCCAGDRGPLARGVWVTAPVAWAALAALIAGPVADRIQGTRGGKRRWATGGAVLAFGGLGLAMAGGRLSSRAALWRSALALDPGDVPAALAVASFDRAHHAPSEAIDVLLACATAHLNTSACACAEGAASDAIDRGRYLDARRALDASTTCPMRPHRRALTAEALIGTSATDLGVVEAERALQADPTDAHAVYARAWATYLSGHPLDARADAAEAVSLGRGVPAELLYGLIVYQAGELAVADLQFERALAEDPDCEQAVFDRALIADRELRYHDAREGYLRALELDPKNADARYDLVVLTHARGATREAQHHLDVFRAAYPSDGRAQALEALLGTPAPVKAMSLP